MGLSLATSHARIPSPPIAATVDPLVAFTFGGELSDGEYAQIRALVEKHHQLGEFIHSIQFLTHDRIEVMTGPKHIKPLSGGGDVLNFRRVGDRRWLFTGGSTWTS